MEFIPEQEIISLLNELGISSHKSSEEEVLLEMSEGEATCGILICGSGIGMSMAANKADGIRAALVHEPTAAEMSRRHNDANVLCLAANGPLESDYNAIVDRWLSTDFEGGRHQRRVDLIN